MRNKSEMKELLDKEQEYQSIFDAFLNSEEDKTFSKKEVKKIIEAHIYKQILADYDNSKQKKKNKNLLVTTKEVSLRIFNLKAILSFILSYIFYVGILIVVNEFIYSGIFVNRSSLFIIALGFTIVDKLVKPFLFIADLISFTFHKIGLVTLFIYTLITYFVSYYLAERLSFEKAIVISIFVLIGISIVDYIKRDAFFKTKYIDDIDMEEGSIDDE